MHKGLYQEMKKKWIFPKGFWWSFSNRVEAWSCAEVPSISVHWRDVWSILVILWVYKLMEIRLMHSSYNSTGPSRQANCRLFSFSLPASFTVFLFHKAIMSFCKSDCLVISHVPATGIPRGALVVLSCSPRGDERACAFDFVCTRLACTCFCMCLSVVW